MSDNVENLTIEILRSIQSAVKQLRDETQAFRDETNARFERLETGMRKDRRNAAGMLVMVRATAGDFDARVSEVEERVATLEARA
ncbi:hypothetical protein [uncultured Methylobacterium sp.]|uniref:hypothetical protein n=1 Tax=uncultured Methylobacterium sp. TaxID=157278 RepID=UPI0035C99399